MCMKALQIRKHSSFMRISFTDLMNEEKRGADRKVCLPFLVCAWRRTFLTGVSPESAR